MSVSLLHPMDIYVDGGCRRNGQPNAMAAAACVIIDPIENFTFTCRVEDRPTNQRAELTAFNMALQCIIKMTRGVGDEPVALLNCKIYGDSQYAINCLTWVR